MTEYILRLVSSNQSPADTWQLRFTRTSDEAAGIYAAEQLQLMGKNPEIAGAMLFRLVPSGTILEYVHIRSFKVTTSVVVQSVELVK